MKKLADSTGKTEVSDKDVEKFYKENPDKFKFPEQVRASHILIMANPYQIQMELTNNGKKKIEEKELKEQVEKKIAEKEALAQKLAKELKADSSKFAAYAKKYSDDEASAKQGGDLGFFAKEQMVPEFGNVAFSAKPNTVSDVVKTQFGYHIILVQDRKAAGTTSFEKAKSSIKDFLTREKQILALDELASAAKKKAKIEFSDERYNPEEISKKLNNQVNDITKGKAQKTKEKSKK
jgi:peptidyl-prolyl cis-trans isomerase C